MTSTSLHARPVPPPAGRVRRACCLLAILACLPYLGLKLVWLGGSRIGIPHDSILLDGNGTVLHAVNALTLVMDALVILLALALVRPWGRRLPAALLLLPLWAATGLLAPMLFAVPVQAVLSLLTDAPSTSGEEAAAFLDGWVSQVVYGSFTVQGVALCVLLAGYLRDRWGHLLRGPVRELHAPPGDLPLRCLAGLAITVTAVPLTVHLLWACGTGWGLSPEAAVRMDAGQRWNEAGHALFAAAAVAALLALVFRASPGLRLRTAVLPGWVGSGALATWGGWWLLMALASAGGGEGFVRETSTLQWLTYSAQMISGLLALAAGVLLARRLRPGPLPPADRSGPVLARRV